MLDLEKLSQKNPSELRDTRIRMSKEFEPEPAQRQALIDLCKKLLMTFNAYAPKDLPHTDHRWACFLKPEVRPVVRAIGESAYRLGGMGGLYFLCDIFNTIQAKTLGSTDHASVSELNIIWDQIGDLNGEPVKDYWLS